MGFALSQIIKPQFLVITTPTALTLVTTGAGGTATTVPAKTQLTLSRCRVVNVTGSPVSLELWWVTSGGTAVDQYKQVSSVNVPVASMQQPYFEWSPGIQLAAGDAIFGRAGTASALTISGSGGLTT